MRIVQSFWSGNNKDYTNNYGWASNKYHWTSWILSCHQLVKYHEHVELYTDSFGYEILIEKLKLPYTKVHVVLDELNNYHKDLWAIAKIKTFQLQKEPFIHVDGDVFVWESLTDKFEKSNLVTQNLEITTSYYREKWNEIHPHLSFIPDDINDFNNSKNNLACNMGIIGGTNLDFFKDFTEKSIAFVDNNKNDWNKFNKFNFNIFFEQVLFYEFAYKTNQNIDFLFPETPKDNEYLGFGDFYMVPNRKYLHLLGSYKRGFSVCKAMEVYTMKHYPEAYSRLTQFININDSSKHEIDFLTFDKVDDLLISYENNLKNNLFQEENYLLKRDLYNDGLPNTLDSYFDNEIDFKIILGNGFKKQTICKNDKTIDYIEIQEINCLSRIYELDEIDELIIKELAQKINYTSFIDKMLEYVDKDNLEINVAFVQLLKNRLKNYIIVKIISIYKENEKIS